MNIKEVDDLVKKYFRSWNFVNNQDFVKILQALFSKIEEERNSFFLENSEKTEFVTLKNNFSKDYKRKYWYNIHNIDIKKIMSLNADELDFILLNSILVSKSILEKNNDARANFSLLNFKNKQKKIKNPNFIKNLKLKYSLKDIYLKKELEAKEKELGKNFTNWCISELLSLWRAIPETESNIKKEIEITINNKYLKLIND